jgi:hypothetical protein
LAIDPVSIPEEVIRSRVFWKSLGQLTEGPDRGGVVGDVEMEDFAAIVPEDDDDEEEPERER